MPKRSRYSRIVILTGAGISADSGLSTFRDPDGLWAKYDVDDVATPGGFARDPDLVLSFYNARRRNLDVVEPNPAHHALARLEKEYPGEVLIVTLPGEAFPEVGKKVYKKMNAKYKVLIGLGNDEVGYIVPKEDWNPKAYEESVSLGPKTEEVLLGAIEKLLKDF